MFSHKHCYHQDVSICPSFGVGFVACGLMTGWQIKDDQDKSMFQKIYVVNAAAFAGGLLTFWHPALLLPSFVLVAAQYPDSAAKITMKNIKRVMNTPLTRATVSIGSVVCTVFALAFACGLCCGSVCKVQRA